MTPLNSRLQLALLNRKKGRNLIEKGFTLVELMIVIVIVGILSAIALPNFLSQTEKAKATEAKTKMSAILKQGHAEWQEAGSTAEAIALALSESGGKFTYVATYADNGSNPEFWIEANAIASDSGGDASLAEKEAFGCVNLDTGETKMTRQLLPKNSARPNGNPDASVDATCATY